MPAYGVCCIGPCLSNPVATHITRAHLQPDLRTHEPDHISGDGDLAARLKGDTACGC